MVLSTSNSDLPSRQLERLVEVLQQEYSHVDRDSLGHWCGLNAQWWLQEDSLESYFKLLLQLHVNEAPNITLRVARRAALRDMGTMGYAILSSDTLHQSLRLICQFAQSANPYMDLKLTIKAEHALVIYQVKPEGAAYHQLLIEYWLISTWRYIQDLLPEGLAACASYAALSYRQPSYHGQYQQLLGCRSFFDEDVACLAIPRQWLQMPIHRGTPESLAVQETQVRRLLLEHDIGDNIVSRVKRLLVTQPTKCRFQLEATAQVMSLSARTLRRQLADAGTTFRRICLEVRVDLAKDYLANTRLTIQEIAFQLGYQQPNNFHRAFKEFAGTTPDGWRGEVLGRVENAVPESPPTSGSRL